MWPKDKKPINYLVNLKFNLSVNRFQNWPDYWAEDKFAYEIHVQIQILPAFDSLLLEILTVSNKTILKESTFYKLCQLNLNNHAQINFLTHLQDGLLFYFTFKWKLKLCFLNFQGLQQFNFAST